jgi:hypothetical protein
MSTSKLDVLGIETIKGSLLKGKYVIGRFLDEGSNGQVHKVMDQSNPQAQLVVKMSSDC